MAAQADDAIGRIRRIESLLSGWKLDLARERSRVPERALDLFSENPFWTVGALAERLGVAYTTAQRAVSRLEALGAVSLTSGERRNRVYCARAISRCDRRPFVRMLASQICSDTASVCAKSAGFGPVPRYPSRSIVVE